MKKIMVIMPIVLLILSLFTTGCGPATPDDTSALESGDDASMTIQPDMTSNTTAEQKIVYDTGGDAKYYPDAIKSNLEQVEEITDTVVIATALKCRPKPDMSDTERITLTTIRIDKVLKSDGAIKEGAEYTLIEFYKTVIYDDEPDVIHILSYDSIPLNMDGQYLLFLSKSIREYGDYEIAGLWQGKFPITEKSLNAGFSGSKLTAEDMEFPGSVPMEDLWIIAGQAYEKYLS